MRIPKCSALKWVTVGAVITDTIIAGIVYVPLGLERRDWDRRNRSVDARMESVRYLRKAWDTFQNYWRAGLSDESLIACRYKVSRITFKRPQSFPGPSTFPVWMRSIAAAFPCQTLTITSACV